MEARKRELKMTLVLYVKGSEASYSVDNAGNTRNE